MFLFGIITNFLLNLYSSNYIFHTNTYLLFRISDKFLDHIARFQFSHSLCSHCPNCQHTHVVAPKPIEPILCFHDMLDVMDIFS